MSKSVQVGRVVNITYGKDLGKLAVIVEVIDHQRALVDGTIKLTEGPTTGVARQPISFKRATLTDIVLTIPRSVGTSALKKMIIKQDLLAKWNATSWAKKIEKRSARANLSDFDRFKVMLGRKQKSKIVGKAFAKERKAFNKK
jgi:large subunit ribosomal protein L14e